MTSALSITSPLQGTIWQLKVAAGDEVRQGQELIIIESMKMEHPIKAPESGVISVVLIDEAATVVKNELTWPRSATAMRRGTTKAVLNELRNVEPAINAPPERTLPTW